MSFKTDGTSADFFANIKLLFGIISVDIINNKKKVTILGFIKFNLDSIKEEVEDDTNEKIDIQEDKVKGLRGFKIAVYKLESKLKKAVYKTKRTVKKAVEYKYKMELIKKIIEYAQKILDILKPKHSNIKVTFGTGNAAINGKLMGAFAILKAKYKNLIVISDFEKKTLKIDINADGHISLIRLIIIGMKFMYEDSIKELRRMNKKGVKNGKKRTKQ